VKHFCAFGALVFFISIREMKNKNPVYPVNPVKKAFYKN